MSDTFIETQITATETQITALNAAVLFLSQNPHKSYELDTGQSRQRVNRDDLITLQQQIDMLLDRRQTLLALCNGATVQIQPGF